MQRSGNQIRIRGNNRPPVVVVDDVMYDAPVDEMEQNENSFGPIGGSILESIVVSDIASLEIMKEVMLLFSEAPEVEEQSLSL